jgi:E3 ubiquitin-protein ligase CCNP1IP1
MALDQDNIRRKNEELIQAFRDKSRKLLQTQELYDKLKRRDMLGQVQNAASDAVDHTIQASVTASRFADRVNNQNQNQRPVLPPRFSSIQSGGMQYPGVGHGGGPAMAAPTSRTGNGEGTWAGFSSQGSQESVQRM